MKYTQLDKIIVDYEWTGTQHLFWVYNTRNPMLGYEYIQIDRRNVEPIKEKMETATSMNVKQGL
jgi:hypothetical protein